MENVLIASFEAESLILAHEMNETPKEEDTPNRCFEAQRRRLIFFRGGGMVQRLLIHLLVHTLTWGMKSSVQLDQLSVTFEKDCMKLVKIL